MSVKETTTRLTRAVANFSNRYAPAIITMIILACFFFYYFSVVVKTNESHLKERKFRGLHQVAANINNKLETYEQKNARNFIESIEILGGTDDTASTEKQFGLTFHKYKSSDSLTREKFKYDSVEKQFEFYPNGKSGYATVDLRDFLQPLLRRDIFNQYLLANNGSIVFDELNISHKQQKEYFSTTIKDDTIATIRTIESGNLVKKNIGGKDYWLFSIAFSSGDKYKFTIGGYITDDQYETERTYIPPYGILCLVIGVILVIVLIPLLKVFLMHRSEQLVTMAASSAFAAVHLLASILFLSLLTLYVNIHIVRSQDDLKLKTIATGIEQTLDAEIQTDMKVMALATADLKINTKAWKDSVQISARRVSVRNDNANKDTIPKVSSCIDSKLITTSAEDSLLLETLTKNSLELDVFFDALIRKDSTITVEQTPREGKKKKAITKVNSSECIMKQLMHVYWTDTNGQQRIRWTKDKVVPQKINVNDRDYFKAVVENKMFYNSMGQRYHFTDIASWVTNSNFAVISMPARVEIKDSVPIIMVSGGTRLKSVFSPLLPFGYSFCIVDQTGQVLFHKETIRNLNENFLQECGNKELVQSILTLRKTDYFETRYAGSTYRFFCKPLDGTTYSLLTFHDMQQSWAKDLDITSATSILALFNLGLLLSVILAIKGLSYSKNKTKVQNLALTWLRPSGVLRKEYISITCFFAISMVTQVLFIYWLRHIDKLAALAATFTYTYLMLIATFHRFSLLKDPHNKAYLRPKKILMGMFAFLTLFYTWYWCRYGNVVWWLVLETLIYLLIYLVLTYRWKPIASNGRKIMEYTKSTWLKPGFRHSYTWFVGSLIVSTSIVPLFIFYLLCYDEQNKMSARYAQWDFAKQLSVLPVKTFESLKGPLTTSFRYPYHFTTIADNITRYSELPGSVIPADPFSRLYRTIKPSFFHYNLKLELLHSDDSSNTGYLWRQDKDEKSRSLYFNQSSLPPEISSAGISTKYSGWKLSELTGPMAKANLLDFFKWPTVLLIAGLLIGLYSLLRLLIKKIFFIGAMQPSYAIGLDILTSNTTGVQGNLFIYGPPGTHKIKAVKDEINKNGTFVHIDLSDLANKSAETQIAEKELKLNAIAKDSTILLITNININSDDPELTGKKLLVLEHFQKAKRRLFIVSSKYFESLGMFEYNQQKPNQISYTARWENLMKSFYTVYHRWQKEQPDHLLSKYESIFENFIMKSYNIMARPAPPLTTNSQNLGVRLATSIHDHIQEEIQKLINKIIDECSHSAFLCELTEPMIDYASELASPTMRNIQSGASWPAKRIVSRHCIFVFEKVCDRIESLAQNHYLSIWNAVTPEEQRTLYDIAIDELVNPLNRKTAARLCEIGLVKPIDGIACYNILNVSFRNYILNHVANNEIRLFKKEIAAKGFGSSIQLPLVIVAIAALAFIVFTQKEAFASFISYIGAAFAGITGLVKIISSIPTSKPEGKA